MTKLEEAELALRDTCHYAGWLKPDQRKAIADELDRLRAEQERWRPIGEELARHVPELGDTGDPARVLYAARCVVDDREGARCRAVATELARAEWEKRATTAESELSKLKGEAECLFYVAGLDEPSPAEAIRSVLYTNGDCETENDARAQYPGHQVYAVRLSARKLEP